MNIRELAAAETQARRVKFGNPNLVPVPVLDVVEKYGLYNKYGYPLLWWYDVPEERLRVDNE